MNSFKPGLVSKSNVVASWSARLISKLGLELNSLNNLKKVSWEWFTSNSGGLHTCILALKRHNDIKEGIVSIME
jgi:hypothetical protein